MGKRYFSEKVVEWYLMNQRSLPWRGSNNAYFIWLSEIILQQTRVIQGTPYYLNFVKEFPTIQQLAAAPEQKVLRLWQGLGYYTRARNLHKCAKEIIKNHKGKFPDTFEKLKLLPGIGDYTAAAVASIAFKEPVAVVDGNVFRVLSRIFGIDSPINSPRGKKVFTDLANELISIKHPDLHNQAVMEFGALYCTPKNPVCTDCVFKTSCFAYKKDMQQLLPVKIKSKASRNRYFYYFIIKKGKSILMRLRNEKDIWHGLYDFFLVEKNRQQKVETIIHENELLKKLKASTYKEIKARKHILSHQNIHAKFIILDIGGAKIDSKELKFYSKSQVWQLPKPALITNFLKNENLID